MRLYRIAALSKVWVEAEVYESDLAQVHAGQHASVTLDYLPGRAYEAKVAYVYPYLEATARTGRVRLELANEDLELRPGMYASVELSSELGTRVQVPAAAVVYTGPRRLVFVDLGSGRFRPQEVQVGAESAGMYEVRSGLSAGDRVATSGVFLIAAEARIATAAKYWDSTSETSDGAAAPPSEMPGSLPLQQSTPTRAAAAPPGNTAARRAIRDADELDAAPRLHVPDAPAGPQHDPGKVPPLRYGSAAEEREMTSPSPAPPPRRSGPDRAAHRREREPPASDHSPRRGVQRLGLGLDATHAARRHSRSVRRPGHRLHRVDGPEPRSRRGPGHVPDFLGSHLGSQSPGRAGAVDVRHVVRQRRLRRRHRHLLGAQPRARVSELRSRQAPERGESRSRSRRNRRRVGVRIRARRHERQARPRRASLPAGLEPALRPRQRPRRGRGSERRRVREAVPGERRPKQAAGARGHDGRCRARRARREPGGGGSRHRDGGSRAGDPRARLREEPPRHRAGSGPGRRRHPGSREGRGDGEHRPRHPAGPHRARWRGRSARRDRRHALRRERAHGHRRGQGSSEGDRDQPSRGRARRTHVRPLAAHRGVRPHAQAHAHRGDGGRERGHFPLPPSCAERAHSHSHAPRRSPSRVRPHGAAAPDGQHHVPGRHRRRHRGDGRRVHHHHREHSQEARGARPRRPPAQP